jgi:hypothetical protein
MKLTIFILLAAAISCHAVAAQNVNCSEAGLDPRGLVQGYCADQIEKMAPEARAETLFSAYYPATELPPESADTATIELWKRVSSAIIKRSEEICSKDPNEVTGLCKVLPTLRWAREAQERRETQRAERKKQEEKQNTEIKAAETRRSEEELHKQNDPRRAAAHACSAHESMAYIKKLISREERAARIGGSKDLKALHDLGLAQVSNEDVLETESVRYKKLTGKNIDFSICKDLPQFED